MAEQKKRTAIVPTREEDYNEWYQQVVAAADLAENAPVRGCMIIKPWGYALWEGLQKELDQRIKATGHKNAYFPLFIPLSYLEKEAAHVEGFAKECAVVTHHRLVQGKDGALVPDPTAVLEEPLVVRPTSETIIGEAMSRWVQSYRDLPLLLNQWANVVRWELRTRLFLRTAEFLWQEGHTAHATAEDAEAETMRMLDVYADVVENVLAIPVLRGRKTPSERFPGAVETYCIEAMMQDRKALQAGTSHFLGQHFAKASEIRFQNEKGVEEYAWTTSWGVSTRLLGALIMSHSDDNGLVLPPKIAPTHVVILPVVRDEAARADIFAYCESLKKELEHCSYAGRPLVVEIDARDMAGGDKAWQWVKKGVPVRVEVGAREVEQGTVAATYRVVTPMAGVKVVSDRATFVAGVADALDSMQRALLETARAFRETHMVRIATWDAFVAFFTPKNAEKPEIHGGFAIAGWCGGTACEGKIKEELKVTARCIPLEAILGERPTTCVVCGDSIKEEVVYAKAY
jgi:prolyl-tRNA synthetase